MILIIINISNWFIYWNIYIKIIKYIYFLIFMNQNILDIIKKEQFLKTIFPVDLT